jgi:hypothetical protein
MDSRHGLSGEEPALQAQKPKFQPQFHQNTKPNQNKQTNQKNHSDLLNASSVSCGAKTNLSFSVPTAILGSIYFFSLFYSLTQKAQTIAQDHLASKWQSWDLSSTWWDSSPGVQTLLPHFTAGGLSGQRD